MGRMACAITGCQGKTIPGTSFHRVPTRKDDQSRSKWIAFIKKALKDENWIPGCESSLCSGHFKSNCFYNSRGRRYIFRHSVPTIMHPSLSTLESTISYVQDVVDPITVGAAALLLHTIATSKWHRPLKVTLGIDDDCGDSISFADPSATSRSSSDDQTQMQNMQNGLPLPEYPNYDEMLPFCPSPMEILPDSSSSYMNFPSSSSTPYPEYIMYDPGTEPTGHICPIHSFEVSTTEMKERVKSDHAYANSNTEMGHNSELIAKLLKTQKQLVVVRTLAKRRKRRIMKLSSVIKDMDALFHIKPEPVIE